MGAPPVSPLSSLDRLKALDALPDLVSQLQEAKQLCHHSARAEMILRWLMAKLKTSEEARGNDLSWDLLTSTVRLLPAQRIAVLSNGMMPALQLIWATPDLAEGTVHAIAQLFRILLEIGQSTDGAAVKSLLSVGGDTAAKMCGDWYRHVYRNFSQGGKMSLLTQEALLDPALQLWELRKQLDSDDTSFNDHCMVPVLLLLARLRNNGTLATSKRRRGQGSPVEQYEHALEALVSKHTVLPARTVFNRKLEQQPRLKSAQPTINDRLSSLKEAIANGVYGDAMVESIHLVLDVALGSVSTPTPRHRFAERPWLEAVFAALNDCVAGQNRLVVNRTLIHLLETVRRKGAGQTALSAQTLTLLVKHNAITGGDSNNDVDWQLVAKVVELEPDVLTNLEITEDLFDTISRIEQHQSSALAAVWRDQIILPAMKAFAHTRSLTVFLDLWHRQVLRSRGSQEASVWEDLSVPFADILEDSLLPEQIVAQIDRFSSPVSAAPESKEKLSSEEVASPLLASIVLLDSLLAGIRSDDLVLSLHTRFEALLHSLIELANLKGFKTILATSHRYWGLLARVFQLWYPFWASKQDQQAAAETEGMSILTSKTFKSALAQCSASENIQAAHTGRNALAFIASVCACFQQYGSQKGCAGRCAEAMAAVAKNEAGAASILSRYPSLLQSLDPNTRKGLVSSQLSSTSNVEHDEHNTPAQLQALLASSCGTSKQHLMEDLVPTVIEQLRRDAGATSSADETLLDSTLASIDVHSLEQGQRIQILDTLSQLGEVPINSSGPARLQARLALILKLLELPCQNAQILTDASRLWELASLLKPEKKGSKSTGSASSSQLDSLENVELLQEIVQRVLSSLFTTQDRERTQAMLVEISQRIKDTVKLGVKSGQLSINKSQLAISRVAITMLEESARDDVKQRLVHRAPKTMRSYLDTLAAECSAASGKAADLKTAQKSSILFALEALLHVPTPLVELSGIDTADHAKRLSKLASDFMSTSQTLGDEALQSRLLATSFRLICRNGAGKKNLTTIAEDVLERDLTAKDRATVTLAYEEAFKQADAEWKLTAVTTLTTEPNLQRASSLVMLQQTAIKALTKEDAEAIPATKDIVLHTLQAATSPTSLLAVRRTALISLALIFKDRPFLATQYTIEKTLAALHQLLSSDPSVDIGALYLNICQVLTVVLAHHRSRLQGRFHLLIALLQQLMSYLFSDGKTEIHQAQSLAKLLESFCNPPALRYRKGGKPSSELVDEAKRAQAHAGQFAQYLLHFYCGQVLSGSLGEGVREALLPGLWAMIEAMEAYNEDGVKVLSAAANNSERAVLRSVYEDWKRFGKWEGV